MISLIIGLIITLAFWYFVIKGIKSVISGFNSKRNSSGNSSTNQQSSSVNKMVGNVSERVVKSVNPVAGAAHVPPSIEPNKYYAQLDGKQEGPYDMTQFARLVQYELADENTMVWKDGMKDWAKASEVEDLKKFFTKASPSVPSKSSVPPIPPTHN